MLTGILQNLFNKMGYTIVRTTDAVSYLASPLDMEKEFMDIYHRCKDFTMTSIERMYSLYKGTEYVVRHNIPGDIVECGVWKGGSAMVCALTSLHLNEKGRTIYLYDTFEGMSEPTDKDVETSSGDLAWEQWNDFRIRNDKWAYAPIEEVRKNMYSTGYPREKLVFVRGRVEDTIPATVPESISLLRLDTDWYESTYHELCHLFPRLSAHGVIVLDDYGHWKGAREAADKYFRENAVQILLSRIDYTARIGIKVKV
jgi:hypothetical protein